MVFEHRWILSPVRLPVPPLSQKCSVKLKMQNEKFKPDNGTIHFAFLIVLVGGPEGS